jgi:PAS domain S-box-containing protein
MTPTPETHAVVLSDRNGRILYFSPGAEELFGHSAAEAIGQSLDVIVPDAFREKHWAGFHRAMASGQSPISGSATNLPVKCRAGAVRSFPARFVFLADGHGDAIGAVAIYGPPVGGEQVFGDVLPRTR